MSEERTFGNQKNQDAWIDHSFQEWDAGEPSDIWKDLDESLSLDAVWNRVDASLTEKEAGTDEWLREAHNEWSPVIEKDQWARLNDSLSLENVWTGLDQSLDQPVTTRIPYWKLIAASLVAVFFTQYFSDAPVSRDTNGLLTQEGIIAEKIDPSGVEKTGNTDKNPFGSVEQQHIIRRVDLIVNNGSDPSPEEDHVIAQDQLGQTPEQQNAQVVERIVENPETKESNTTVDNQQIDPLATRMWKAPEEFLTPRDFMVVRPYHHWTLQMGTQLSVLKERDQEAFTSTLPRFGMAADLSYRHRVGPVQLIHAIGMSQYEQVAGKYINGRHSNTDQKINALQLSSSVAYSYGKFTFYGGLLFSKMLSGLEQNNSTIIKVYNFNRLQTGFTGGIDYRLVSFPNSGKHISIGSQYQLLPSYKGEKTTFENIHGIRFQAKFSF